MFKIPEGIAPEAAAPMLCGGITLYSPLKNHGCGPGKKVGIIGVGGLGHFGVIFAKALGADKVVGISRKADKKDDVLKMGADEYVATSEDKDVSVHPYMSTVEGCKHDGQQLVGQAPQPIPGLDRLHGFVA